MVKQVTEERLGQILWAWIERTRANDPSLAAELEGLTAADVQELVRLFQTAEQVQQALAPEAEAPAVLPERLRVAMEQRQRSHAAARSVAPPPRLPWSLWSRLPLALSAAAGIAVGLIGATSLSTPPESLEHPPPAVPALSHSATVSYFPRLSSGSLPSEKRKAVFWHLSHCSACFDHFESTLPKDRATFRSHVPGALAGAKIQSRNSSDKLPGGS